MLSLIKVHKNAAMVFAGSVFLNWTFIIPTNPPNPFLVKDILYFVMTPITSHGKVVAALRKVGTHGTYHRHLGLISGTYLNLR